MSKRDLTTDYSRFFMATPAVIWYFLFLFVPLLVVIGASVYTRSSGFTSIFYSRLLDSSHARVLARSALLAFWNAFVCLIVAYPVVYYISFCIPNQWKNVFVFLLTLPFWVNFVIHVYSWFFLLDRHGLFNNILLYMHIIDQPLHILNSTLAVAIVMFQVYVPFMILPLYVVFEKFDTRLLEASTDLGASPRKTFTRITLPLTLSGARQGFLLVFGMSFGEYLIPQLMAGSKTFFVGTLISDYFLINRDFAAGSAFTCLSAAVLIGLMLVCLGMLYLIRKGIRT